MTHVVSHRNRILLGVCAVAAAMAFATQGLAHGAMGMGARGMAMQPPSGVGPHPFDPSGHLNGPLTPAPRTQPSPAGPPRTQPAPSGPRLDPPPGGDASAGAMATQPPTGVGPHPFDPSGHLNGPMTPAPTAPRTQPVPSAPRLDPPPK